MLEAILRVDVPGHMAQAVKECLCMTLEAYGDVRAISVRAVDGVSYRPDAPTQYYQERIPMTGGQWNAQHSRKR